MSTTYSELKRRYDSMAARDRRAYDLARKAVNALGFALQNAHNDNAVVKYEKQSDDAMKELFELLTESPQNPETGAKP